MSMSPLTAIDPRTEFENSRRECLARAFQLDRMFGWDDLEIDLDELVALIISSTFEESIFSQLATKEATS